MSQQRLGRKALAEHTDILSLLKFCVQEKDLKRGTRLHAEILKKALLEKDCYIASSLVNMYAKCGALEDATRVLDDLPFRDVAAWSALIAGYVQCGKGSKALYCFECMQSEGLSPNVVTFICILKACGNLQAVEKGECIHREILRQGLLRISTVLGNALVDMYAKCGALTKAAVVFAELPVQNVVSWNALIGGYALHEQGEEVLICYGKMQQEGIFPNAVTFTCMLKVCGKIGSIGKGKEVHDEIVRHGLMGKDRVLGNALVDMYAKCGVLVKALEVFDGLPVRDLVTWDVLILGYGQKGLDDEALRWFQTMQLEGLSPNIAVYVCVLNACASLGSFDKGKQIHKEIIRQGLLNDDSALASALVYMYAKCGALEEATLVLEELYVRNVVTWSSLIAGYVQQSQGEIAVLLYDTMQEEGLLADSVTLIIIMSACGSIGVVEKGEEIHNVILKRGFLQDDVVIGNALLDMYVNCGLLEKAALLFDELLLRDRISWNTMIAAYVEWGQDEEALKHSAWMQCEGVSADEATFTSILIACGSLGACSIGEQIHTDIICQGVLAENAFLGNALVNMYSKCGELEKAEEVLEELYVHNVVSWSALIAGYVEQNRGEKALSCFEQMQIEGVSPDYIAVTCILKACGSIKAIEKGEQVYNIIIKRQGFLREDSALAVSLVELYVKCDALARAAEVLDEVGLRTVIAWNTLISGYVGHGWCEEALNCFQWMLTEGVSPDMVTLMSILRVCGSIRDLEKGEQIHYEIVRRRCVGKGDILWTSLVYMYAQCGALEKAARVLLDLPFRNVVLWNTLIIGCVQFGQSEKALNYFIVMQDEGFSPDVVTFTCAMKACGNMAVVEKGEQIHDEVVRQGLLGVDKILGNALVDMYAKCGALNKAARVLSQLPFRDIVSWSALITGYCQQGQGEQALKCYEQMQSEGLSSDIVAFISLLKACGDLGVAVKGEQLHNEIVRRSLLEEDIVLRNSLVDMYAKCGALSKAARVLDELPVRDVVSWTALMAGYAQQGHGKEAIKRFEQMQWEGLTPNAVTLVCVLSACACSGLVEKGQTYFVGMSVKHGIAPDVVHYTCIVDLFGRRGEFCDAVALIKKIPSLGYLPLWHALLSACANCGNSEVARLAFDHAIQVDEYNAVSYALMTHNF